MSPNQQSNLQDSVGHDARYPIFGIIPRSRVGQMFLGWAVVNIILALLPVFNIYGNSQDIGISGMPTTVFYSYAVFTLNCLLGAAYFLTRGLAWVDMIETTGVEGAE
ncbi:hypothetical protein [Roseobacter sp.]|uniref:hypothetical protein n=1 Tax=Roseobacter sp. TaxID=1907202 RepID=UPI003296E12F